MYSIQENCSHPYLASVASSLFTCTRYSGHCWCGFLFPHNGDKSKLKEWTPDQYDVISNII